MHARDAEDRLAVRTYQEAGEVIPLGDPSVTDAEREAAGRETLADRGRAILPANRSRAAAQFAAAGLPCRHSEWIGGHDSLWWERQLPIALGWLLSSS